LPVEDIRGAIRKIGSLEGAVNESEQALDAHIIGQKPAEMAANNTIPPKTPQPQSIRENRVKVSATGGGITNTPS
jgi:hypothetical protein